MPSNLVTFPHAIVDPDAIMIVNASNDDIETLSVWLSSQDHTYHVHFYNSDPETEPWAHTVAGMVKTVFVNDDIPGWDYHDYDSKVCHYSSDNPLLNFFNNNE